MVFRHLMIGSKNCSKSCTANKRQREWNLKNLVIYKMINLGGKAMKCKWSDEDGECELRCGIADDPTCDGSEAEQYECAYVDNSESSN